MNTLIQILQLIPAIIQVIKAIEDAIPGNGQGEQKLAMVREILVSVDASTKEILPSLEKVIGILVKTFNAVGAWK